MLTYDDYINAVKSNTVYPRMKICILNPDETIRSEITQDCVNESDSINISSQSGSRRSATVTLNNTSKKYLLEPDSMIWGNTKFKLYQGIRIGNEDYFFAQGVYILKEPEIDSLLSNKITKLDLVDKYSLLNSEIAGTLDDIYEIDVGTSFIDAVKGICNYIGDPAYPIIDNRFANYTLPGQIRKDISDSISSVLEALCNYVSAHYFYDVNGHLVIQSGVYDIDDSIKPVSWKFSTKDNNYFGCTYKINYDKVANAVIVDGNSIQTNGGVAVRGVAKNENLASPFCIQRLAQNFNNPRPRVKYIQDQNITTVAEAIDRAQFELKKCNIASKTYTITSSYLPHLDVNNIVSLTDSSLNFTNERMLITSISSPFNTKSSTTIQASSVNEIGFSVS